MEGVVEAQQEGEIPVSRCGEERDRLAEARRVHLERRAADGDDIGQHHGGPARGDSALHAIAQDDGDIVGEAIDRGRRLHRDLGNAAIALGGDLADVGHGAGADGDDGIRPLHRLGRHGEHGLVRMELLMPVIEADDARGEASLSCASTSLLSLSPARRMGVVSVRITIEAGRALPAAASACSTAERSSRWAVSEITTRRMSRGARRESGSSGRKPAPQAVEIGRVGQGVGSAHQRFRKGQRQDHGPASDD